MNNGVTIVDPDNTWIEPFTYIHGVVKIGQNCRIGPFAYLRDGAILKDNVEFGAFKKEQ